MQRLSIAFKALCITLLALIIVPVHSMKRTHELTVEMDVDQNQLTLTKLPPEHLFTIFSFCLPDNSHPKLSLLETAIHDFINLRLVCTAIDAALSFVDIGRLCAHYSELEKSNLLQKTLYSKFPDYSKMRLPAAITLVSYKNTNKGNTLQASLLNKAIECDDLDFTKIVCTDKTNPNVNCTLKYACYRATTKEMLELLIKEGADIHITYPNWSNNPNVLWHCIEPHCTPDLLKYCLELGVNPKSMSNTTCLLHRLALAPSSKNIPNLNDHLLKAGYLLNAAPTLINHQDSSGQTPLDYAHYALEHAYKRKSTNGIQAAQGLIALLCYYGACSGINVHVQESKDPQPKKRLKTLVDDFSCMTL